MDKPSLRTHCRALRRAIPPAQRRRAARAVARHWSQQRALRRARHVAVYLAFAAELDTAPLIRVLRQRRVRVYAPRIGRNHRLHFLPLGHRRRGHRHGMAQPVSRRAVPLRRLDVLVLPLLAFDAHGRRLGQGGGYYDRLLARLRGARRPLCLGLAYAAQQQPALPVQAHDRPLHAVLTEKKLRRFARVSGRVSTTPD